MKLFDKMKNILFDEEDVPVKEAPVKPVESVLQPSDSFQNEKREVFKPKEEPLVSEKEMFKQESRFPFPEFDEDEFDNNMVVPERKPSVSAHRPTNSLEFERRAKKVEKRPEYNRYDKTEPIELAKRKFKPSPIISPVYGVLNEDYKPEDIKERMAHTNSKLDVDSVRKKAFGELEDLEKTMEKPVTVLYEATETVTSIFPAEEKQEKVKTIDELLEDTSDVKIDIDEEFDMTDEIKVDSIVKEEKEEVKVNDDFDNTDTLENDLFDLIDSMYESNKEED